MKVAAGLAAVAAAAGETVARVASTGSRTERSMVGKLLSRMGSPAFPCPAALVNGAGAGWSKVHPGGDGFQQVAGRDPLTNRFEIMAGLEDGNYVPRGS